MVVTGQNFFQYFVVADSRPGQIGFLIEGSNHETSPLQTDSAPPRRVLTGLRVMGVASAESHCGGHSIFSEELRRYVSTRAYTPSAPDSPLLPAGTQ
jgi:hypothetical protein